MDDPVRISAVVVGIAIVAGTVTSVFTTLVVPRASSARMLRLIARLLATTVRPTLRRFSTYEAKDKVMAVVGPLSMVLLFVVWLVILVVGFGLIVWWAAPSTFPHALAISGSSIFTLGVATISRPGPEAIESAAAGTGLLVIALEIAYLPTLYSAFSTREAEVTVLAARAGLPAWGPEVLARHQRFGTMGQLPALYASWELWAAQVSESHPNYPSLMWFRSPAPRRSWLVALAAVLDAAAMHDALSPGSAPREARLCLQMGVSCLRSIADALRISYDPDPHPTDQIRLTYPEFNEGVLHAETTGFPIERTPEEAWRHFCGWRVNYEPLVDALTRVIVPPPAPWLVSRPELGEVRVPTVRNRTPDDPGDAPVRTAGR
jgi:hypothetical protein